MQLCDFFPELWDKLKIAQIIKIKSQILRNKTIWHIFLTIVYLYLTILHLFSQF